MDADVIIVGTGQAAVPLAARLAAHGRKVLVVERAALGGTCVNYGCTPTKTMIASARAAHVARTAARLGVRAGAVEVDLPAIVDRKQAIVKRWRDGVRSRLQRAGERLTLIEGHARFVGEREIEVDGARHRAPTIVINTGARPVMPLVPGLSSVPWLDNARALELRELPAHLIVLGGGYIGCELGQMFRRFGAPVTIVDHNARLLVREDEEVSAELEIVFTAEGITLALGAQVRSVRPADGGLALALDGDRELRGSHLLVATGRRPNTDELGCDAAGIALDAHGSIAVDDRYRTSAEGIFAVGDVTPGPQFTHTSWDDHRLLFDILEGHATRTRADRLVPHAVFTDPQVAGVGLNERAARERGVAYDVATLPFGAIARAVEADETAGTMKLLVERGGERVLGATIMGAEAAELIHVFVALMSARASVRAIVDAEFVHPAYAEGVQSLVMRLNRFSLS
jgi:pyruvate/2-oxoglutarate dehydrogenase complex dihydrolipoamide dehydrogenase (E3) component